MSDAIAVVLAAGKGTRMQSDLAKVMFPVCGRPMIHFVLDALAAAGFGRQVVVVGHQADRVEAELSQRPVPPAFVLQAEQLGTGHAVQVCREHLVGHDGPVIVVAGDSPLLQPSSLEKLLEHFQATRPALLLGTLVKADPKGLGRIVRNEAGEFLAIVEEKDASEAQRQVKEVNMSTYLFNGPDLLEALDRLDNDNSQGEYYLTDTVQLLRKAGRLVAALPVLQPCEALSINNREELQLVDAKMRELGYPCEDA
jgi:bifunctional UDP-N-acetylglucosamine pyrophosphorylase/glucosamine-1-phosphate N-acetyltransferase/UDP-N-acetylglucosamine pyrophosphorylase